MNAKNEPLKLEIQGNRLVIYDVAKLHSFYFDFSGHTTRAHGHITAYMTLDLPVAKLLAETILAKLSEAKP